jgi:aryl-alcohol dehydrogenase-like predicted oxidoreductase
MVIKKVVRKKTMEKIEVVKRRLGASGVEVSPLGIGVWAWGDKGFWQYGGDYGILDIEKAYQASLSAGIDFFDTAEIYGNGTSEQLLGKVARKFKQPVVIASKFAPFPFRFSAKVLPVALDASLQRLGVNQLDLYQIHWAYSFIPINDLMDQLAEVVKSGKVKAVGVSNYNAQQMRQAHARLAKHGVALASNQVHYNLLKRSPEVNGVLKACQELDVALIAYSPLAQGILTGKFNNGQAKPGGPRQFMPRFQGNFLRKVQPLLNVMESIGKEREKSVAQVALNWLIHRDEHIIPIPGAKNERQAQENAGALGWSLNEEEARQIDKASRDWLK